MDSADFAEARRLMVVGQLRPTGVSDTRLLAAMASLPRERFLPASLAARAYSDASVPLPGGRMMPSPLVAARMTQLAGIRRDDRVLVLGAGSGFGAALAGAMGARVIAVEDDEDLVALARVALSASVPPGAVQLVVASPRDGHAAGAPYDAILIEGAVPALPRPIEEQLAEGGRLVAILAPGGGTARATLVRRVGQSFTAVSGFDAPSWPAPAFAGAPDFVF